MNTTAISDIPRSSVESDKYQTKKFKLLSFAYSILRDPAYKKEFNQLFQELNLNEEQILDEFLAYNLDIYTPEGNKIYESLANRVVLHIHNLLKGSWHIERQQTILDFLKMANPKSIADIGFGIPSQYVKEFVLKNKVHLVLCDLYQAAFTFARSLLKIWQKGWDDFIQFKECNMDALNFVGMHDIYLFIDSIEHTIEPAICLKKYIDLSPKNACFLLSLPIGPLIPRHYIAWETDVIAQEWLASCGLSILQKRNVYINPEIDLFAEQIGSDYHNLIVLCAKRS